MPWLLTDNRTVVKSAALCSEQQCRAHIRITQSHVDAAKSVSRKMKHENGWKHRQLFMHRPCLAAYTLSSHCLHPCILVVQYCPDAFILSSTVKCRTIAGCIMPLRDTATKLMVRQTCSRTGYESHLLACNSSNRLHGAYLSTSVISVKATDHAFS